MKGVLITLGMFTLLNVFSQAKIKALEMGHDFDTLFCNDPVSHDFKVVNIGNEPLLLYRTGTTCGCDFAAGQRTPVFPGDTAVINYQYDSKRPGLIKRQIIVMSNAVNTPRLILNCNGYIQSRE